MSQAYSDPARENDPHALPDLEIFYETGKGWFYWFCSPGCLPDSDPIGPFATEHRALTDARQYCGQ